MHRALHSSISLYSHVQGWAKKWAPGLVKFVPAVAYRYGLNLPARFTQPWARLLSESCTQYYSLSPSFRGTCSGSLTSVSLQSIESLLKSDRFSSMTFVSVCERSERCAQGKNGCMSRTIAFVLVRKIQQGMFFPARRIVNPPRAFDKT